MDKRDKIIEILKQLQTINWYDFEVDDAADQILAMDEWVSVDIPCEQSRVIAYWRDTDAIRTSMYHPKMGFYPENAARRSWGHQPTHYKYLPEAPK